VARGEDTGSSDIDLLVTVNAQAPRSELLTLLTLSEELTKIVGAPVEVSSERILDPDVRRNALQDAVAL
jgi:predicted nucleotidyltransferase